MSRFISLVTLVVPDYDAAIAFYVDKLGFALLEDTELGNGKRWVRVAPPGSQTALLLARATNRHQQAAIGNQAGGRVGFFLQTDYFARDYEQLRAKAVDFREEPRKEAYGNVAVFTDPFGNDWDLVELRG
ncbi:MAG: VOC family protein [Alphaproteobacteria bacterium]|nr:VOC family protein [Alphaproteobacteria bacterium]